jgi:hypothetical protein
MNQMTQVDLPRSREVLQLGFGTVVGGSDQQLAEIASYAIVFWAILALLAAINNVTAATPSF